MLPLDELVDKISKDSGTDRKHVEKLVLEKQDELSGLVSKEGAAYIVGRELGINLIKEGRQEFKIKNLVTGLSFISLEAKVIRVSDVRNFEKKGGKSGSVQNVLLGDETGTVALVLWGEDTEKFSGFSEGSSIKIINAYSKQSRGGGIELSLTKRGSIEKIEKVIEVGFGGAKINAINDHNDRFEIKDLKENMYADVRGCLVNIFRRSPFYFVCPQCGSTVDKQNVCKSHGPVQPQKNLMLSGILDDGTETIRVVLFRDLAEKIYGIKSAEINFTDLNGFYDSLLVLGKEFVVGGRAKKNNFSGELELVANKVEEVDPKKECELILKWIGV